MAHLALVTLWQHGTAECDWEPYSYGGGYGSGSGDDGDPGEEEFEGYTGNAGMTLERWYRRRHLHDIIRSNRCDLTHVTERRGSPFTLVCTKTTASYQRVCKIRERDLSNLSRIEYLENRMV